MRYSLVIAFLLLQFLLGCGVSSGSFTKGSITLTKQMPIVEMVGASNEVVSEKWKDPRIGLGLLSMYESALANTDRFTFVENNAEVLKARNSLAVGIWETEDGPGGLQAALTKPSQSDLRAWMRVIYYGAPQTSMSVGMVHSRSKETIVRVVVGLTAADGQERQALGEGRTTQDVSSVLFKFNEDSQGLNETAISIAVRKAIDNAVQKLLEGVK